MVNRKFLCTFQFCLFDLLLFLCTSCTVDWNLGACLYGFQLLDSRVAALFIAGTSRVFLICFGVQYWLVFFFSFEQDLFLSITACTNGLLTYLYFALTGI